MNFNLTDEQTLIMQTVRRFAEEVAPGAIERDGCPITVIAGVILKKCGKNRL